jgi:hypothetical protein
MFRTEKGVTEGSKPAVWFKAALLGHAPTGQRMSVPLRDASEAAREANKRGLAKWEVFDRKGNRIGAYGQEVPAGEVIAP